MKRNKLSNKTNNEDDSKYNKFNSSKKRFTITANSGGTYANNFHQKMEAFANANDANDTNDDFEEENENGKVFKRVSIVNETIEEKGEEAKLLRSNGASINEMKNMFDVMTNKMIEYQKSTNNKIDKLTKTIELLVERENKKSMWLGGINIYI